MPDPQKLTSENFQRWNEEMAHKHNPGEYHDTKNMLVRWVEKSRVQKLIRQLHTAPDCRILEVGVGAGNILAQVRSHHRTGLDLSPFLLSRARSRLGSDVKLVEGNAEELTTHFAKGSFDRVYCSEVLEHVQHPDRVLHGMASLLSDSGIAVVSVPNESCIDVIKSFLRLTGIHRLLRLDLSSVQGDEWHLHSFDRTLLRKLCREHFTVQKISAVPFPFLPLRYVATLTKVLYLQRNAWDE